MSFYKKIADYYDEIFPLKPKQVDFVMKHLEPDSQKKQILDVGCATGSLLQAISPQTGKAVGIDLDADLIHIAQKKTGASGGNPEFILMNMLELKEKFSPSQFDVITSFGNTIVHLDGPDKIRAFFSQAYKLLKPDGKLLIQIIHYDRILNHGIKALPTIETDNLRFERNYGFDPSSHRILFQTFLYIKQSEKSLQQEVWLYPLSSKTLEKIARECSFSAIDFYGDFRFTPLTDEHVPLVAVLSK